MCGNQFWLKTFTLRKGAIQRDHINRLRNTDCYQFQSFIITFEHECTTELSEHGINKWCNDLQKKNLLCFYKSTAIFCMFILSKFRLYHALEVFEKCFFQVFISKQQQLLHAFLFLSIVNKLTTRLFKQNKKQFRKLKYAKISVRSTKTAIVNPDV